MFWDMTPSVRAERFQRTGLLSVIHHGNVYDTFQKKVGKFLPDYTVSLLRMEYCA